MVEVHCLNAYNGFADGRKKGGDFRGLQSAAILIILLNAPPVNPRVDFGDPFDGLR